MKNTIIFDGTVELSKSGKIELGGLDKFMNLTKPVARILRFHENGLVMIQKATDASSEMFSKIMLETEIVVDENNKIISYTGPEEEKFRECAK